MNPAPTGFVQGALKEAIIARRGADRVLPFRYLAAARAAPQYEPALDRALHASISGMTPLRGRTVVLVDVSGSMDAKLSAKSDLTRRDAAAALASIIQGDLRVFAFADCLTEVPARRGMAGIAAINAAPRGGTKLFDAIATVNTSFVYDRLIVITDEQSHPSDGGIRKSPMWGVQAYEQSTLRTCPDPKGIGYMINVASAQRGVGYGKWLHIDGFSENVLRFINEWEAQLRSTNAFGVPFGAPQ